jgi:hypothetical protein
MQLVMDMLDGRPIPRRGDRLSSPRTLYWVMGSRQVKRRDPVAVPRARLFVAKANDIDPELKNRLLKSALRRGSSQLFEFTFYPRKKKSVSFEQYLGAK